MIQVGVFAKIFQRRTAHDVLQNVRDCGFESAHFNFAAIGLEDMPEEIIPETIEQIKSATRDLGIPLVGISGTFNMAHPDSHVRSTGLKRLEKMAQICPETGIPLISLCSGSRNARDKWAPHPDNNSSEAWKDVLKTLETAILIAERNDVYLGIEPELANVINTPLKAFELITEMQTDRIKIIFDPANLFEKATPKEIKSTISSAFDLLHPFLIMAHAKDRSSNGQFTAPGLGTIPFDFLFECLQSQNINIPVVAHGFSEKEAKAAAQYLKSIRA